MRFDQTQLRTKVGGLMRVADVPVMVDTGDVQPGARVTVIAAHRDHDAGRLDAVAGSEFLDDRIRLRE
jgi:hypothetical protein